MTLPPLSRPSSRPARLLFALGLALGTTLPAMRAADSPTAIIAASKVGGDATLLHETPASITLRLEKPTGRGTVQFDYPAGALNLSAYRDLALKIKNHSGAELDVLVTGVSNLGNTVKNSSQGRFLVRPQESSDLRVLMTREALPKDHPFVKTLGNLYASPWGHQRNWQFMDTTSIRRVSVRIDWHEQAAGGTIELGRPFGLGAFSTDPDQLKTLELPLLDTFGQLRGRDWPGKVANLADLQADAARDQHLVNTVTQPRAGRDRFGGMAGGPSLKATGFFRVEKLQGKWWFVDPDGNLFWSHGINTTGVAAETIVTGREPLFPETDRAEAEVVYLSKNLALKHGTADWEKPHVDTTIARLFDWGLNTIGAWSLPELAATRRVPYTLIVHANMQGFPGVHKIPDPYSDAFKKSLHDRMSKLAPNHADSPWLLGVFIDNELEWKGNSDLVEAIIKSPKKTPARRALIEFLQQRHGDIAALNQAWKTTHPTLADIQPGPGAGGTEAYAKDLKAFLTRFADTYFSVCREAMTQHFPNHLYLGCRFHITNPIITAAASRVCDVISVNVYRYQIADFAIPTDQDRPYLISEFHFGVRDYGPWGTGLVGAADARNQADLYKTYLSDALRHPHFVGTHWFQWTDQIATGRTDGENFGVGLVSVVDRPTETLVKAVREVGDRLYPFRLDPTPSRLGAGAPLP